jgi:hypothetical protein
MKKIVIVLIFALFSVVSFAQCNDSKAGEMGLLWTKEVVIGCTEKPNKLKISVTDCSFKNGKYEIKTKADWDGGYSTFSYSLKLIIEVVEPNDKNKGKITVYFMDYTSSVYKSLTYTCIDLQNTKAFKTENGETEFFPYKEFDYKKIEL